MKLRLILTIAIVSSLAATLLLGCSSGSGNKSNTTTTTTSEAVAGGASTETEATPTATISPEEAAEIEAIRQVIKGYWEAFNSYNHEKLLTFMTDSWGEEAGDGYKSNMNSMRWLRIKIGVTEEDAPHLISPTEATTAVRLKTPIGTKIADYILLKIDGEWKINSSVER